MLKLTVKKHELIFKQLAGTSRGTLRSKPSWFFILIDSEKHSNISIGECGLLTGLSFDDKSGYLEKLFQIVQSVNQKQSLETKIDLSEWPSINFGLEMLKKDYYSTKDKILFDTEFTNHSYKIPINGLIWMGEKKFMFDQIKLKIDEGWSCIKLKIGAIDFEEEIELIKYIRAQFGIDELELRVDANGAFLPTEAKEKMKILSDYDIHSIEQPIGAGQEYKMAELCDNPPLPIALDEELIGVIDMHKKQRLLKLIKPQYIILKPSLIGGWNSSEEWINIAKQHNIKYWATSALESNIGLNAIAQWTATLEKNLIHGLGTGQLYTNNIDSPLQASKGYLSYEKDKNWLFNI